MTTISSTGAFNMTEGYGSYQLSGGLDINTTTQLEWDMVVPGGFFPPIEVLLEGTGFAFDGDTPVGGTVTRLRIELDQFDPAGPVALITDFSLNLTEILVSAATGEMTLIAAYGAILGGSDVLTLGDNSSGFGDLHVASGGTFAFASDRLELVGENGVLWGDAATVNEGATATGGDDDLSATGTLDTTLRLFGDVQSLVNATLTGGEDRIAVTATPTEDTSAQPLLYGDALEVVAAAHLMGGADTLQGASATNDRIFGDADILTFGTPTLTGGDDILQGYGGDDILYGDLNTLDAGVFIGGDDTLRGGSGNDFLYGDYARFQAGTVQSGGDDVLDGRKGKDVLFGAEGNDLLLGGNGADTLLGGAGNDTLRGGFGDDVIYGGPDGDRMKGGPGADTFVWQGLGDVGPGVDRDIIWKFVSGVDTLDLRAIDAAFAGGLTWVGEDYTGALGTIGYTERGQFLKLAANLDDSNSVNEFVVLMTGSSALTEGDVIL